MTPPEDLLNFVELDEFYDDWETLGLNDEHDKLAFQLSIMSNPRIGKVIEGAGGLRKVRFAPSRWKTGKSGAARVCYVYFEEFALVLLVAAYDHKVQDNLSAKEKQGIRQYIEQQWRLLSQDSYRQGRH